MALETGTFISDLVPTNPVGSDPLAFADDHLRLVKGTLKNTFPNISGAVTRTHGDINNLATQANLTALETSLNTAIASAITTTRNSIYPVGSIYVNATNGTNPSTLLGFGTWVEFGVGRVMVGLNGSDALFDTLEETGGSKDATLVSHTHTMNSVGDHQHFVASTEYGAQLQSATNVTSGNYVSAQVGASGLNEAYNLAGVNTVASIGLSSASGAHNHSINSTGSSATNANLQPYITVAMWKRTA